MSTLAGNITPLPSVSSLIGRIISIFRQKLDGLNPSEKQIKVLPILAPTFIYTQIDGYSIIREIKFLQLGYSNRRKNRDEQKTQKFVLCSFMVDIFITHFIISS